MKILITLGLVQTGILLLLLGKNIFVEEVVNVAVPAEHHTLTSGGTAYTQPQSYSNDAVPHADEDRLRQIIREELRAELGGRSGPGGQADVAVPSNSMDAAESRYQRDFVTEQLEYHTSVGRISDSDMQLLQKEIAKLDTSSRTARDLSSLRLFWSTSPI